MADLGLQENILKLTNTGSLNSTDYVYTTTFDRDIKLLIVTVRATIDFLPNDILNIYFDSSDGSNYDSLIMSQNMFGASEVAFYPDQELFLKEGDQIRVEVPQLTGATCYINVIAREA